MINSQRGFFASIPPVTKNLIIINILVWLASIVLPKSLGIDLYKYLGMHFWEADDFNPIQLFTYMFMHDDMSFTHLLFNMFSVFIFGRVIEQVWGAKRFLFYYISTGLGAAIVQQIVWTFTWSNGFQLVNTETQEIAYQGAEAVAYAYAHGIDVQQYLNQMLTVGASGAVFGLLLAFGMMFPNAPMYLMFIPIPIKAKYLVIGYGVLELFFGISGMNSLVAHFAHLGGMIFGFIILYTWKKKGILGGGYF